MNAVRTVQIIALLIAIVGPGTGSVPAVGSGWTEVATGGTPGVDKPAPRWGYAMAYDTDRGVTVLFGGDLEDCPYTYDNQTWEWNGSTWANRTPASSPPARDTCAMVYDSARHVCVLFGGFSGGGALGDMWEWDGQNWEDKTPGSPPRPEPTNAPAMAYDSSRGRTVMFGGIHYPGSIHSRETWEWDGSGWTLAVTDGPSARESAGMAYDEERGVTVLFGGWDGSSRNDTWVWNGTTWTEQSPPNSPPARSSFAMDFDAHPSRRTVVIFGGYLWGSTEVYRNDTWDWNGQDWTQASVESSPSPRFHVSMTYDRTRSAHVLFGGIEKTGCSATVYGDTWEYRPFRDCNANGIDDEQDIAGGTSYDVDHNGIPDECEGWVQWPVNGHYYRAVLAAEGISWTDANAAAMAAGAYLATATSVAENGWLFSLIEPGQHPAFWNGNMGPWLGGLQQPCTPEPSCGWGWVTGEPFPGSGWAGNWCGDEPNNSGVNPPSRDENRIHFNYASSCWNDQDDQGYAGTEWHWIRGYIVEFAGDCNQNGISDDLDILNHTSQDCNNNGVPDECELDSDGDGIIDACDNCPSVYNPGQEDCDGDGLGDVCDADRDGDGVPNDLDVCPDTPFCENMPNGSPRLDLNGDCEVNGLDIQLIVQQLLDGCSACP